MDLAFCVEKSSVSVELFFFFFLCVLPLLVIVVVVVIQPKYWVTAHELWHMYAIWQTWSHWLAVTQTLRHICYQLLWNNTWPCIQCLRMCFYWQVHVDEERFKRYSKLGDMLDFVTTDGSTTQLHACRQSVSTNCSCMLRYCCYEWMNEWMMFLLTCDKKLTKSQLNPTHASN